MICHWNIDKSAPHNPITPEEYARRKQPLPRQRTSKQHIYLTDAEGKILAALKDAGGRIRPTELADRLNVSTSSLRKLIRPLKHRGKVSLFLIRNYPNAYEYRLTEAL